MQETDSTKSAYDLITGSDADILASPEAILELYYECPDCGQTEGMRANVYGARAICWCPDCREEHGDDDMQTHGVHDLVGQYICVADPDFSLRDVPADRATVIEN